MREFKRHLIPFPRVGKRQSLIPFPRVGRSQQYLNYPADDVSSEVGNVPEVDFAGIFVGSENEMVPVFDMQGTLSFGSSMSETLHSCVHLSRAWRASCLRAAQVAAGQPGARRMNRTTQS